MRIKERSLLLLLLLLLLNSEEIISEQQSGFRSLHSTVTALLEATDSWLFNIDRGYVNTSWVFHGGARSTQNAA